MPEEAAVVEAEPVAEPVQAESPVVEEAAPEVAVEPTGESAPAEEGEWSPDFTPDEWKLLLSKAPAEVLDEAEPVKQRLSAQEQREQTRQREMETARKSVDEGYNDLVNLGKQAQDYIKATASELGLIDREIDLYSDPDRYDAEKLKDARLRQRQLLNSDLLSQAVAAAEAGATAKADLESRRWQTSAMGEVAKELKIDLEKEPFSKEEMADFEQARYEDAQRGQIGNRATKLLMQKLIERHGKLEYERGRQAGLKDRAAQATLVDKLAKVKEMQNGSAPNLVGQAAASMDRSLEAVTNRIISNSADDKDRELWNERFGRK